MTRADSANDPTDPIDPTGPDDAALRDLFTDAVRGVEPSDRLGEIRRGTSRRRRTAPRWTLAVIGAGTATAAVVGVVALVGGLDAPPDDAAAPPPREAAVATYFTGPDGLYREFQSVPGSDERAVLALSALQLLEGDSGPIDPDYSTVWPDGSFTDVVVGDGAIRVHIGMPARTWPDDLLLNALVDLGPAFQQVVRTAQAAVGEVWPVTLETGEQPVTVLGVPVEAEIGRDPSVDAPVNITDPAEGHTVDDLLTLRGIVGGWGADLTRVLWELRSADDRVVASGALPVRGRTWEHTEDIADLPPGAYVLSVADDGLEDGPFTDTRTVTIR